MWPGDCIRAIFASLGEGGCRAGVSCLYHIDLEIYVVVDLLEERVVELEPEVRRPSDCLGDEACEHQFSEKWVATDAAKDHEAKHVGAEGLKDRCEAQDEHEASCVPVRHAGEGHRLVLERRHNDLDVTCQSESYARQEDEASFDPVTIGR